MADVDDPPPPSRRAALRVGLGLAAATGAGFAGGEARSRIGQGEVRPATAETPAAFTVADWIARRGPHYYIAHRGAGDVVPEHSMAAYEAAAQWGASCIEVSVRMTSDGVLVCMHDATYDRTTTGAGAVRDLPSTILRAVGLRAPQLGPAWSVAPLPEVPRFEDVLRRFAGRVVLCVEAKDDAAYPAMAAMIDRYRARASVIVKVGEASANLEPAHRDGFAVFAYFGTPVPADNVRALGARLRKDHDYLVITPGSPTGDDSDVIAAAIGTGVPVWVAPIHRRSDAARYFGLGVSGVVTSSYGYVARTTPLARADAWRYKAITPGELTRHPDSPAYAPTWSGEDELALESSAGQQFLTLGNLCPPAAASGSYRVTFDARWTRVPTDPRAYIALAFAHADDRYYESRLGVSDGFHAILRVNGSLELFAHGAGQAEGRLLGAPQLSPPAVADRWMSLSLAVTPDRLTWTRTDAAAPHDVTVTAGGPRGGYLHLGRTGAGSLALRHLRVS